MKNRLIYFFLILAFTIILNCKSCHSLKTNQIEGDKNMFEGCGECLHLHTGNVCTVEGTFYNSCLAICKQVKILCEGKCPCPSKN